MKICYFGTYERSYARNQILINGLKENNIKILECHEPIWENLEHKTGLSFSKKIRLFFDLIKAYIKLPIKYFLLPNHDAVIVGHICQFDLFLAKILTLLRRKPVILDAFYSLYNTMVEDRKVAKKGSFNANMYFMLDKLSCKLSTLTLLDTDAHIDYFHKTFRIKKSKFHPIYIGANDKIFYPRKRMRNNNKFIVFFHGKFIPLQGIPYILKAAKILKKHKDIEFHIIGGGQLYDEMFSIKQELILDNVYFKGFIKNTELPVHLSNADLGLGVFGDTKKAQKVIPNKAYEILAMNLPLITGNSLASREKLTNNKDCILCNMADPESLANAILLLKNNPKLRNKIAEQGYDLFKENFSMKMLGKDLANIINQIKDNKNKR